LDRSEALQIIEALLEREGRADVLAELKDLASSAEAAAAHTRTMTEVTRVLLENEKTYRFVFSHEMDPMSLFDASTGRFLEVNQAWTELYGYSRDEALGMHVTEVSAEPEATARAIAQLPPGAATHIDLRWHRAKDGTVFPVELTSGKLSLGGREVAYVVMRDFAQRQRAERQLARSEASFRALIESMPDGVIVHRLGRIVYMSPSARRMLGYALDEDIGGMLALDIVHADDRASVVERVVEVLTHGGAAPIVEERLLRKDGTSVVAEIAAHSTVFDGEQAMLVIARDVSARKEIDAQLVLNDRLASLGRLSASIGHELNNPLAYVLGNVTLMQRELARTENLPADVRDRLSQHVTIIREGAERMRDIVRDLKTLARGDVEQPSAVDVRHILEVCMNMAEREIAPRARLVREAIERAFVASTEPRLGQLFLNVLLNAAQAIPAGDADGNEVRVSVRIVEGGGHVAIEISDTGTGIAPEHMERIFEPFFTTKEGEGTGLGLAICHRIVTSAGGTLSAHPNAGRGTVFRVVLPTVEAEGEP
jgi:two-component system, NtrC family, sensor kinase